MTKIIQLNFVFLLILHIKHKYKLKTMNYKLQQICILRNEWLFTFEQQRHEGDFGRLHFLESVSVGFVIHGRILKKSSKKSGQSLY